MFTHVAAPSSLVAKPYDPLDDDFVVEGLEQPNDVSQAKREVKNKRSENIAKFDAASYYQALPQAPADWSPPGHSNRDHLFKYNRQGELRPNLKFSREQLASYLQYHPLAVNLKIWLQVCPADSKRRYPDPDHSSRCRYENCPVPNGTIEKGDFRVAFDEQWHKQNPQSQLRVDPFHNAGYLHLFCFEKLFDVPVLCKKHNVEADVRLLPQEKKRMAIDKDGDSMKQVVENFIKNSKSNAGKESKDPTWYPDTLCCALTVEKARLTPRAHKNTTAKRNGNSYDKHWNNLEWLVENLSRKRRGQQFLSHPEPVATYGWQPAQDPKNHSGPSRGLKRKSRTHVDSNDGESQKRANHSRPFGSGRPYFPPASPTATRTLLPVNMTSQHVTEQSNQINQAQEPPVGRSSRKRSLSADDDDEYAPPAQKKRKVEDEQPPSPDLAVRRKKHTRRRRSSNHSSDSGYRPDDSD
jgi:hypothetical protein